MNIHEYQAKAIFNDSGVKVVKGIHCTSVDEALNAYDELNSDVVAVKARYMLEEEEREFFMIQEQMI